MGVPDLIDARLWTLARDEVPKEEMLGPGGVANRTRHVKSEMENAMPSSPKFFLFSAYGDPYQGNNVPQGSRDADIQLISQLGTVEEALGLDPNSHCLFQTLRPYHAYLSDYDSSQQHRKAITFLVRLGRNRHALTVILRIHLASLSAVAVVTAKQPSDLSTIRSLCASNTTLLRTTPLGLLAIVLKQRTAIWEQWVVDIYQQTNEIEDIYNLAPPEFITEKASPHRKRELMAEGFEGMLGHLSGIHVRICHGINVLEAGVRFAAFCKEAVGLVHGEDGTAGIFGGGLKPGERAMLEERIAGLTVRCEG